jgi:hypothetical protein
MKFLRRRKRFVDSSRLIAAFKKLPATDAARFRADVDRAVDQNPTPRAPLDDARLP